MKKHGIKRELVVKMERNFIADSLSYLTNQTTSIQSSKGTKQPPRRASVASTSLFAMGDRIREAGYDFFGRIPRSNEVQLSATSSSSATSSTTFGINEGASTSGTHGVSCVAALKTTSAANDIIEYEEVEYLDSSHSEDEKFDQNSTTATVDPVDKPILSEDEFEYEYQEQSEEGSVSSVFTFDDSLGIASLFDETPEGVVGEYAQFNDFDHYEEVVVTTDNQAVTATVSTVNVDSSAMVSADPITQNEVTIAKQGTYHNNFEDFCIEYNE